MKENRIEYFPDVVQEGGERRGRGRRKRGHSDPIEKGLRPDMTPSPGNKAYRGWQGGYHDYKGKWFRDALLRAP
jgi:hypothetical protein